MHNWCSTKQTKRMIMWGMGCWGGLAGRGADGGGGRGLGAGGREDLHSVRPVSVVDHSLFAMSRLRGSSLYSIALDHLFMNFCSFMSSSL